VTNYVLFNLVFGAVVSLTVAFAAMNRRHLVTLLQTAIYVTLVAYPWDHFAIVSGAWTYENPGPLLFRVPINDIVFIFLGSLFSSVVLSERQPIGVGGEPEPEAENGRDEAPHHEVD
jgi:lycopene cyclase domain-containing protein